MAKRTTTGALPADLNQQIAATAEAMGVKLVRFLYTDNGGIIRGKAAHINGLANRISDGIGLTVAMQAMNMLDQLAAVEGMGPVGEIRLTPDPATFRALPYAPYSAAMTSDMLKLDGTTAMTVSQDATMSLIEALEEQNLPVELYYPELGHGQQEISIHHADPLTAADNHIFTRETIRNVAYLHGLIASLAPKPFADQAGNGGHIHFSLWDNAGKRNLMYDPSGDYAISEIGRQFIAGILDHLPGLLALSCACHNSYRRLQPHYWSSAYTTWGPDNREGAVRVASRYKSDAEGSANAELKSADLSANPYLAFGGLIAAGLDGIRRKLDPGEPTTVDPGNYTDAERANRGIKRFPTTLGETVDALEKDTVLTDALGPLLATAYMAVKRLEYQSFSQQDEAYELKHHFWKF
jgi:glutamine synthetase